MLLSKSKIELILILNNLDIFLLQLQYSSKHNINMERLEELINQT